MRCHFNSYTKAIQPHLVELQAINLLLIALDTGFSIIKDITSTRFISTGFIISTVSMSSEFAYITGSKNNGESKVEHV
jgi:hypothetical protein